MRKMPQYPQWKTANLPNTRSWFLLGTLSMLLTGGVVIALQGLQSNAFLLSMLLILFIISFLWLCSFVYYRTSKHHEIFWRQEVDREYKQWWKNHRSVLALHDVILIGPAGSEKIDWYRVLTQRQRFPIERQENGSKTFRIARIFSTDQQEREQQLANMLAMKWLKQLDHNSPVFSRYFWLGSQQSWLAFCSQVSKLKPKMTLPDMPEPWQGESTLSFIATQLQADNSLSFLVAGALSCSPLSDKTSPAGECAVLWHISADGSVVMTRGEVFEQSSDSLKEVCERVLLQSELDDEPEACISFSHLQLPELVNNGWSANQNIQDKYWGDLREIEPLCVISLAAILAQYQEQPCVYHFSDDAYHHFVHLIWWYYLLVFF